MALHQIPVRFAVVGFGRIGRRHCAIIANHPQTQLAAVIDIDSGLKEMVEKAYGVPFFSSLEEFFNSGIRVDVVNICTPNGLHAAQAIEALQHGCHVVCEKPMALSRADCEKVIHASLFHDKRVFVVMQNRYSPPARWLKSIVDEQITGKIYLIEINCLWNRDRSYYEGSPWKGTLKMDGGPLFTQFSHFIDIMYWVFGDIHNIDARFNNFNHRDFTEFEDTGTVVFEFSGDKPVVSSSMGILNYTTSVARSNFESSLLIIAEKGTVKIGGQYMETVEVCDIEGYEMPQLEPVSPPNRYGNYTGSAANHHFVIQNVVDTLTGNSVVTTNALEGMKVVEIIERIYKKRSDHLWRSSMDTLEKPAP